MNAFSPGDKVLFARVSAVGTVVEPTGVGVEHGYYIETAAGTTHFADADQLTLLPTGTPLFNRGDSVQVAPDAPYHAGLTGTVSSPELHGPIFGYWLNLGVNDNYMWTPAEALSALVPGGGEVR
ncbi:hypothetical protein Caci_2882 [Catenulispora acidiphila DSM 44928]|uniref:Uncharacterized protein n=1 Tax=Catenulispora acidiphila (strain DSM 44928 / JCM 14897 / NBRC 102108 / NRRL B-24433 / ID139908) TaxID=479433 RepID=C7Q2P9_CATAD|nr:hypothetical protein [Catenulispora acidiphila]ACU71791.1 hypothetical protein Caci_2882 [Catenulispora acidiphila DSM 44928]